MKSELANELTHAAVAGGWTARFAALWFNRKDLHPDRLDPDGDRPQPSQRRARQRRPSLDDGQPQGGRPLTGEPTRCAERGATQPTGTEYETEDEIGSDGVGVVRDASSTELELFPPTTARAGSRFDDTVAYPIDTPQRLDAIIRTAGRRLRALPELRDLGHRTIAYRARLQQVMREAAQARARLADGTYGACHTCSDPISFARLAERPWARRCIYCELDI